MTAVYDVGTATLNCRMVASVSSLASGSPEARTLVESADGTKAIVTGLSVEPLALPVGAGGACGLGRRVCRAAAGVACRTAALPMAGGTAGGTCRLVMRWWRWRLRHPR